MSHEALRDELFETLKGSTHAKDINHALNRLRKLSEQGQINIDEVNTVLSLLNSYGGELEQKGQFKKASHQFYTGGMIVDEFFPQNKDARDKWWAKSAEMLRKSSEDHVSFEDIDGAAACITISALLEFLMTENTWTVPQYVEDFVDTHKDKIPNGKWASGCVYIPYDLVEAIQGPNPERLERAESYTTSYLLVNSKIADLFVDAIKDVVQKTRQRVMDKIKLPKLHLGLECQPDLVYDEKFTLKMAIRNQGEGLAKQVKFNLTIPSELKVIEGKTELTLESLQPKTEKQFSYVLMCPEQSNTEELHVELSASLAYTNILNDIRTIPFGPYELIIRASKKSEELLERLEELQVVFKNIDKVNSNNVSEKLVKTISEQQHNTVETLFSKIKTAIENNEFELAEKTIDYTTTLLNENFKLSITATKDLNTKIDKNKEELNNIAQEITNLNDEIEKIETNLSEILE